MTAPTARRTTIVTRIVPLHLFAGRPQVLMERSLLVYRRSWMVIFSGFFEPVFYLLAIGQGVGALVGDLDLGGDTVVTYAAYVAPALLATSAMNGAVYDATTNVFFKLRYAKLYDTMLATSLGPLDVAIGEIWWSLTRGGLYAGGFVAVLAVMGLFGSPWMLLAVPAALLIAAGFAAVAMALTSFVRSFEQLDWLTTALLPMFLFSTTFYPLTVYPEPIQVLVQCLPLYHGIELIRGLSFGQIEVGLLGHASYFVVMVVIGLAVVSRRLEKLLQR